MLAWNIAWGTRWNPPLTKYQKKWPANWPTDDVCERRSSLYRRGLFSGHLQQPGLQRPFTRPDILECLQEECRALVHHVGLHENVHNLVYVLDQHPGVPPSSSPHSSLSSLSHFSSNCSSPECQEGVNWAIANYLFSIYKTVPAEIAKWLWESENTWPLRLTPKN